MSYTIPFPVPSWTYDEALGALAAARRLGIDPLLETVVDMLAELGNPDACFESLQVAGTNGKTSTARYTAAILAGEGLEVALYTSPELTRYPERMELGGAPASDAAFARAVAAAVEAGRRVNARRVAAGKRPYDITEFDLITVGACAIFAEAGVDVAVLEVGMGGRWDATSAVASIRSVAITGIGLDHTHVLGDTLAAIAAEKAAVIKAGRACVLGAGTTDAEVEDVMVARAAEVGVTPVLVRAADPADAPVAGLPAPRTHPGLPWATYAITRRPRRVGDSLIMRVDTPRATYDGIGALKPAYQAANIACAVVLAELHLGRALDADRLAASIVACPTPGRFDVVRARPLALVDACHNPQSVAAFVGAVAAVSPCVADRPTLLAAVLADKDVAGIVGLLAAAFPRVHVTQTASRRALPAAELAAAFAHAGAEVGGVSTDVASAVSALADEPFVACGSITLAGEVAALLRPSSGRA